MDIKYRIRSDKVLLKKLKPLENKEIQTNEFGIVVDNEKKHLGDVFEVIMTGPLVSEIKKDWLVIISRHTGVDIDIGDSDYKICRESEIDIIVEKYGDR